MISPMIQSRTLGIVSSLKILEIIFGTLAAVVADSVIVEADALYAGK